MHDVFAESAALEEEQEALTARMADLDPESPEYAEVSERFHRSRASSSPATATGGSAGGQRPLGLGFSREDWKRRTEEVSGGCKCALRASRDQLVGGPSSNSSWFLELEASQRDAHLPATRKFLGAPLPVFPAETQAREDAAHLRFHRVAVAGLELALGAVKNARKLRRTRGFPGPDRHASRQRFLLLFERPQIRKTPSCIQRKRCARKV